MLRWNSSSGKGKVQAQRGTVIFRRAGCCIRHYRGFRAARSGPDNRVTTIATASRVGPEDLSRDLALHDSVEPDAPEVSSSEDAKPAGGKGKLVGTVAAVGGLCLLIAGGFLFKDQISAFLLHFTDVVDDMGALGWVLFALVYAGLEVLAVPAIPLTMASGAIFGIIPGSILVSFAGTIAATTSFLIARYAARDRVASWAEKNKQFRAVNKVIERDGFKVVTLLRLSPLLPLAASNYLYGLTNVSLPAYFFGTWVGMFPGTVAYVSAGHVGKAAFLEGEGLPLEWWQIALAVGISAAAIGYIGNLAKEALKEFEEEDKAKQAGHMNIRKADENRQQDAPLPFDDSKYKH